MPPSPLAFSSLRRKVVPRGGICNIRMADLEGPFMNFINKARSGPRAKHPDKWEVVKIRKNKGIYKDFSLLRFEVKTWNFNGKWSRGGNLKLFWPKSDRNLRFSFLFNQ